MTRRVPGEESHSLRYDFHPFSISWFWLGSIYYRGPKNWAIFERRWNEIASTLPTYDYTHVDTSLGGINHGYKCDKPNDQPTTWGSFASHMYQTYWGWFSISLTQLVAMKFPRLCHACCVPGSAARAHDSHPEELGTVIMAGKFSNMEVYSYGHLLPRE
jgi:hypothetical protein